MAEYDGLAPEFLPESVVLLTQKLYFMASNKSNTAVLALFAALFPVVTWAQAPLGTRASGMAGAFVGVADDASAVYWNPSGLATGAFVSLIVTLGENDSVPDGPEAVSAERISGGMVALSLPPMGLAYYRLVAFGTSVPTPAATTPPSREEVRRSVQALATSVVGLSLLQSVTDYIVVGATPKVVWGSAARDTAAILRADQALDAAGELDRFGTTTFDIDASVMLAIGSIRAGLVGRNLTAPSFATSEGGEEIALKREARFGAAWGAGWPGITRLVVSADADLMSRPTPFGDRRDLAAGVETWWRGQTIGVRGGVRGSTIGDARTAVTAGVSYAVRSGFFVEAHVAQGEKDERGWSVGARFGF